MTLTQKSIRERLENWARWARRSSTRSADCMTGATCDRMRKAALGSARGEARRDIDEQDALRVELAWRLLPPAHRNILLWAYINNARPEVICRMLSIPTRPSSAFVDAFQAAEDAIQKTVDTNQPRLIIPIDNLIPSGKKTSDSTKGAALPDKTKSPA